jgi:hypothetical protein
MLRALDNIYCAFIQYCIQVIVRPRSTGAVDISVKMFSLYSSLWIRNAATTAR